MNKKLIKIIAFIATVFALNANAAIITSSDTTIDANGNITTITNNQSISSNNENVTNINNTNLLQTEPVGAEPMPEETEDTYNYQAQQNSTLKLITNAQLKSYEEALGYLDCVYSGKTGCSGFDSTSSARAEVIKSKDLDAAGLNSSKKKALDGAAESVLLMLSAQEAQEYLEKITKYSTSSFINEMLDSATIKTVMTMPGENSLALAEAGTYSAEGMNDDSVTSESVMTKQEYIESIASNEDDEQEYTVQPAYLKDISYSKDKGKDVTYTTNADSTKVFATTKSDMASAGMGMMSTSTYVATCVRSAEDDYAIKISAQEVSIVREIKKEAYSQEDIPVINAKADLDIKKANEIDNDWVNRYDTIKAEEAVDRKYSANYLMLEYAVNAAEELYNKAKTETDATKAAEYKKQADQAIVDSKQFYDGLSGFTSDKKAVDLRNRYLNIKGY
jgi:hypothetical protein